MIERTSNLADIRAEALDPTPDQRVWITPAEVLALVDAVEAAHAVEREAEPYTSDAEGHEFHAVSEHDLGGLKDALARFTFGDT